MKHLLLFILISCSLSAQDSTAEAAINKVYRVLSGEESRVPAAADRISLLQIAAWEALAYIDRARVLKPSREDLREAVPDYYHFKKDRVIFKLIDQKDYNLYGFEGSLPYRWEGEYVVILSADGKEEKDRWKLLYLDTNYMALQMGHLSVFFTHSPKQEP